MDSPSLIVRAPLRISFGGGGTDLPAYYQRHGGAVLSAAINLYVTAKLRMRGDGQTSLMSSNRQTAGNRQTVGTWKHLCAADLDGSDFEIPLAALKHFACDFPVDLVISSDVPAGTGLGSSASVCVCVLKVATEFLGKTYSQYELAETAHSIARHALHKPIGKQDEFSAAFGGLNYILFQRDERVQVEPMRLNPEVMRKLQSNLMLFFTGASRSSWEILEEQERLVSRPGKATDALHQIRKLADTMRAALLAGDLNAFGGMLHEGWVQKKKISSRISNSAIDKFYEAARNAGAAGGKIAGAGGGGFLLLFCNPDKQATVRRVLEAMGLTQTVFAFDLQGAQTIRSEVVSREANKPASGWLSGYAPLCSE